MLKRSEALPGAAVIALLEEAVAAIGGLVAGGPGTPVPADLLERVDRAVIDPGDVGGVRPVPAVDAPFPDDALPVGAGPPVGAAPPRRTRRVSPPRPPSSLSPP